MVGGPYVITSGNATGGTFQASNYTVNYINGLLYVTPSPLVITAANSTKSYGQTETLSAFTTNGLQNGETVGKVTETSPGEAPTANAGGTSFVITPGNATGGTFSSSNYIIAYVNGVLSVVPASLVVTVANAFKYYGETPVLTAFSVAGLMNGETIGAFTETSPGTAASASVAGSPYPIMASNASGGTFTATNYNIAYVNGLLTVLPQIQSLSGWLPITTQAIGEIAAMPSVVQAAAPLELQNITPPTLPAALPPNVFPSSPDSDTHV